MAGLVLSLILAGSAYLVLRDPQDAVLPNTPGSASGADDEADDARADAASALLGRLSARLQHGTPAQVAALAAPGDDRAARELTTLRSNVRTLRVTDLTMRFVAEDAGRLSTDQQSDLGGGAWVGDVQLSWRLKGFDAHASSMEVPVTFRDEGGSTRFVTVRRDLGDAVPLWMLERVTVRRTTRALVMTTAPATVTRLSRLADRAVVDVLKVLPAWRGRLVVEVPKDRPELTRVLGAASTAYASIAAVTTTVDGTTAASAPVHIFVNPRVFDPLGPRGSQIVMSHEATHVAMSAAQSSMPTWLLEGFADYVALAHVDLPVSVTASQILAQVRKQGAPSHLPGKEEFDQDNKQLGASYEAAWLACRLLAQEYGEAKLIELYRAADRSSSVAGPFRTVLGSDVATFTRTWRAELRRLAG